MPSSTFKVQICSQGQFQKSKQFIELKQDVTGLVDLYIEQRHVGKGQLVSQNGHYAVRVVKKNF